MSIYGPLNPRYIAFATANGHTPDEQFEADKVKWPGGPMTGFILWIRERWAEWGESTGTARFPKTDAIHAAFNAWLAAR